MADQLLTPAAREALYALAVFPSKPESFSEEAALAVARCSTKELDELLDAGLLEYHGSRYQIHQIIADYAHLQGNEQTYQTVMQRLLVFMQERVDENVCDE